MKQITIYEAKDGNKFDNEKSCQTYEALIDDIETITNKLKSRDKVSYNEFAVKQDLEVVKSVKREFYLRCANAIPSYSKDFIKASIELGNYDQYCGRILSDYSDEFPILYKTYFRFECINQVSGIEYDQPYFAIHEDKFEGKIID